MAARTSPKPSWQLTWLWKTLISRKNKNSLHALEIVSTVEIWMGKLEVILRSGGTVPLDFTLHDDGHALRVANRMEELLPLAVRKNLSDYEIALLLLAAYGHDVGMAPERGQVSALRNHLFSPKDTTLTSLESESFQEFLDEYAERPVILPLSSNPADLALADELLAYYVRNRHNDWSADWLRENLDPKGFIHLTDAVEILIRLCASHHWDFERLRKDDFNPILSAGAQPQIIHLRYLACILRLADILENDPERTPVVLLRHREIADRKKSLIHWQKDHAFTVDLLEDGQLRFHARPPDAHVHRALLDLAGWIDNELQGIAALGENLPSEKKVGTKTIRRDWHLAPALTPDIKPADGSYEYIDGAFRPNTGRLLQLLSGEQLYENPLHAVRELLQNAFDAVREKIARKRIEPLIAEPADPKWEKILGDQEQVTLTLRPGDNGEWHLICEDSGVGLTKELITGHLLVSGTGRRHAVLDLERRCAEKGFHPGLTGQFGIGVLSYFMLAEEVTLETTRYQGCGDGVENWHFTTRGVGSFGELKKPSVSPFLAGGTRISWVFRKERIENPKDFLIKLSDYLKKTLVRIPCRFAFVTVGFDELNWSTNTGWTMSQADWRDLTLAGWLDPEPYREAVVESNPYPTKIEQSEREKDFDSYESRLASARDSLRYSEREIKIAGAGVARLNLCWFELERGRSLIFPADRFRTILFPIRLASVGSWKGMSLNRSSDTLVSGRSNMDIALSVELDFEVVDKAKLAINRNGIKFADADIAGWKKEIQRIGNEWIDEILGGGSGDYYHEINQHVRKLPLTLKEGRAWYFENGIEGILKPLPPAFATLPGMYSARNCSTDSGVPLANIWLRQEDLLRAKVGFRLMSYSGTIEGMGNYKDIPILGHLGDEAADDSSTILFPNEWKDVAIVEHLGGSYSFNSKNPFVQILSREQRIEIRGSNDLSAILKAIDGAKDAKDFVSLLFQIALRALSYRGFDRNLWGKYVKERSECLNFLWQKVADDMQIALPNLRFGVVSTWEQVLIQASPPVNEIMVKTTKVTSGKDFFPVISEAGFLLSESDGKTEGESVETQ